MEEASSISLKSRKNEARILLRNCFKSSIFSLVPFEIWRDIVREGQVISIIRVSQTCWGFKEIVDNLRELLLEYALKYRAEGRISKGRSYLMRCADIGDSRAMFHFGFAIWAGGWHCVPSPRRGVERVKKSAEHGNPVAMAHYAHCLAKGIETEMDKQMSNFWARKALLSNNSLAVGICYYFRYETDEDDETAFEQFKISAEEGSDLGQRWLGYCYRCGIGVIRDSEKAFYWYLKSAEQGLALAQYEIGEMIRNGYSPKEFEGNEEVAKIWLKKASDQSFQFLILRYNY